MFASPTLKSPNNIVQYDTPKNYLNYLFYCKAKIPKQTL